MNQLIARDGEYMWLIEHIYFHKTQMNCIIHLN